jgi:hypothetical protein
VIFHLQQLKQLNLQPMKRRLQQEDNELSIDVLIDRMALPFPRTEGQIEPLI